jgi:predicted RNA-binding Zn ribbon-like protein
MAKEKGANAQRTRVSANEALFLSGSLALDLVNTEMIVRGKKHDILSSPEALSRWWREAIAHRTEYKHIAVEEPAINWTSELLDEVKKVRQMLRALCTQLVEEQVVASENLEKLNFLLSLGYQSLQQTEQGTIILIHQAHNPQKENLLLFIALSASQLLANGERQRLHKCKNERCILFFYDTTKSGTRQWCSLECLNRQRSLKHYQQIKEQALQQQIRGSLSQ